MRERGLLVFALLFGGCYLSHEREIEMSAPDATVRRDTGESSSGVHWIIASPSDVRVANERCLTREGSTAILRLEIEMNVCDEPGQISYDVEPDQREISVRPFVWRPIGGASCPPGTRTVTRDLALVGVSAGDWTVESQSPVSTEIHVAEASPPSCVDCRGPGQPCASDGECAGELACISLRGDIACGASCHLPCQPFPDDAGAGDLACSESLGFAAVCEDNPDLGFVCTAATRDLCAGPCADGTQCNFASPFPYCAWSIEPFDVPSCTSDADCPWGRSCVELEGRAGRRCDVRCRGEHTCPEGQACYLTSVVCPLPKI
jgi:hypothetical protein